MFPLCMYSPPGVPGIRPSGTDRKLPYHAWVLRPGYLPGSVTASPEAGWRLLWQSRSGWQRRDRKSTRLNSSHSQISYAVFCLKKKNEPISLQRDFAIFAYFDAVAISAIESLKSHFPVVFRMINRNAVSDTRGAFTGTVTSTRS